MIYKIQLLTNPEEVQKLYEFIKQFPLDYPDYFIWLKKCKRQLELGKKKAFYAMVKDEIVGNIIFQPLKENSSILEIKNFRVAEPHRKLGIASDLQAMLCSYAKSNGFKKIQVDTHSDNIEMIQFLIKRGYFIDSRKALYNPNKQEIILSKNL